MRPGHVSVLAWVGCGPGGYTQLWAGAPVVQMYSMLVYMILRLVSRIRKELVDLLVDNGYRSVHLLEEGGEGAVVDEGEG